jgi:hypothetical protein
MVPWLNFFADLFVKNNFTMISSLFCPFYAKMLNFGTADLLPLMHFTLIKVMEKLKALYG